MNAMEATVNARATSQPSYRWWQYAAAGFSAVAGIIHVIVTPAHFEEWIGYGIFFLIAAAFQLLLAFVLVVAYPVRRGVLWAGILGNLAIIAMWVVTRTMGVPLGPMAGEIEGIGGLDLASKIAEVAAIVCLAQVMRMQSNTAASGDGSQA